MISVRDQFSNLVSLWDSSSDRHADKVAFVCRGEEYTYFETRNMVNSFAAALRDDFGVKPGDRIALVLRNGLSFIVAYLAAQKVRAIPIPLNTRLKGGQFDALLGAIKPVALVAEDAFRQVLDSLLPGHPYIRHRIGAGIEDPTWESLEAVTSFEVSEAEEFPEVQPDDIATILFTSGTTGTPKGAIIRQRDLMWNIEVTDSVFKFTPDDIHILTVPLFHCTGLESIFPTSVYHGSTCVLDEQISPSYLCDLIRDTGATTFISVPTTLYLLTSFGALDPTDLASLRLVAFSGSPVRQETVERLAELFPWCELINFYGLTETTSIISCARKKDLLELPGTIGRPLDVIRIRVVSEGVECPSGKRGELQIARQHIVSAYYNMPDEIGRRMSGDWFRTGDLAVLDESGFIHLEGRSSDLIIVGGENVQAAEVESILNMHPEVRDSAVVGVPNRIFGEVVKAFVVPRVPESTEPLEIKKFCFERLPSYKVPLEIEFVREIPRSPSGKILKGLLKNPPAKRTE